MKPIIVSLCLVLAAGCGDLEVKMKKNKLPDGWTAGRILRDNQINSTPPESTDPERIHLYGFLEDDKGYRLFTLPATTSITEIVKVFQVGSHGAQSYGFDKDKTIALVADKAEKISAIIPSRITFADSAGMTLQFTRQIIDEEFRKIEELFPKEEMMDAGMEAYISEWDGQSSILEPIRTQNLVQFWWD